MRFRKANKLAATGIHGRAEVLEATQTGMYVNNRARVRLRVRIEAPGLTPFENEDEVIIPVIVRRSLHPGRLLPVLIDPADPGNFEIDWLGNAGEDSRQEPSRHEPSRHEPSRHAAPADTGAGGMPDDQPGGTEPSGQPDPTPVYEQYAPPPPPPPPSPQPRLAEDMDPAERLSKLIAMRNLGHISDEDFAEHKRRILFDL